MCWFAKWPRWAREETLSAGLATNARPPPTAAPAEVRTYTSAGCLISIRDIANFRLRRRYRDQQWAGLPEYSEH